MATLSPYRSLTADRRKALITHLIKGSREGRALFVQRLTARGGFRPATLLQWPPDKLAGEVVRMKAESSEDEFNLLHLLFVELEPAIQIAFLDAAGVKHENGAMGEDLVSPYADAAAVERAATIVHDQHGEDGLRYLRTLARYGANDWPGIEAMVMRFETTAS